MESDADRLAMIRALGGVVLQSPRGPLDAILDEPYSEASLAVDVEGSSPVLTARTSDVQRLVLGKGSTLALGSRVLRVQRAEPDGLGLTRLVVSG